MVDYFQLLVSCTAGTVCTIVNCKKSFSSHKELHTNTDTHTWTEKQVLISSEDLPLAGCLQQIVQAI